MAEVSDVVVVGAGVAGLAAAGELRRRGAQVVVLDKARGVGGRCTTWRGPGELPLDHGASFLHGEDPGFVQAVEQTEGTVIPGWPARVEGRGDPCQRTAFAPREHRFAVVEGVSAFPKTLARGVDVRLQSRLTKLESREGALRIHVEGSEPLVARDLVLALPCEQAGALLDQGPEPSEAVAGLRALLGMLGTVPCLSLMAVYPEGAPSPGWDMLYPSPSQVLQLVSHESTKGRATSTVALVLQGRASFSGAQLEEPAESWASALLSEASRLLGGWAAEPVWTRPHRWRFARTDLSSELAEPPLVELDGGGRLGLAGELFSRGAGVEAAWASGIALARRIGRDEAP